MEKLLIVGIDTLAGSNLALALADRCDVVGISRHDHVVFENCRILPRSLADSDNLCEALAGEKPNWTVYCGPTSRPSWDGIEEFDLTQETRRLGDIAETAHACGSHFTLISTDAIFSGPNLFHRESFAPSDRPSAVAVRKVEQSLADTEALIVRTHLFGWSSAGDNSRTNLE